MFYSDFIELLYFNNKFNNYFKKLKKIVNKNSLINYIIKFNYDCEGIQHLNLKSYCLYSVYKLINSYSYKESFILENKNYKKILKFINKEKIVYTIIYFDSPQDLYIEITIK